ncbi:MAG: RIP metalloprotease RseP [Pseudomonadota bacterium]
MDLGTLIPTFGSFAFTIVAFVIALSIIVAIHEYGHYIVGRWTGIKADVFSIGFGPVLISRTDKHGTAWQIAALPFGGYVKFRGDANAASVGAEDAGARLSEEELRATMHGAPLWARAATVLAGPVFNFMLSIAVFAAIFTYSGVPTDDIIVDEALEFPFAEQELLPGDVIQAVEGVSVSGDGVFDSLTDTVEPQPQITYTVLRDGQSIDVAGPWIFPTRAAGVDLGSAAEEAGIEEGDVILAVDGTPVFDFEDLRTRIGGSEGAPVTLDVWRDGEVTERVLTAVRQDRPTADGGFETRYLIGVYLGLPFSRAVETPGIVESLGLGVDRTISTITQSISGLVHMIAGEISTCNLSGPVGIAKISGQAAGAGLLTFFSFIAVLSTAVGFLNLLPIPVLDGGHLVFHAWEALTGNPPSDRALKYLMAGGLTIMLSLMLFALSNDFLC